MGEAVLAVPGDLALPTGGYRYARELLAGVPRHGLGLKHLALPGSFPNPSAADLAATARLLAEAPGDAVLLVDGLAYGALTPEAIQAARCPVVALVHHPLGLEEGLGPERRSALLASERAALALAERVVATSAFTKRLLAADFGVPPNRIAVAEPGTERARRASGTGSPLSLLAVGAVTPRKAYPLLVEALAPSRDLDWRLTIVGALDRDPDEAARLRSAIAAGSLDGRVALPGAVAEAELADLVDRADVFVSSSLFEGYGMGLAEAVARGLPIVASSGGAAAETVPSGAGLLARPGEGQGLAAALRRMMADPELRRACADQSWQAAAALPSWEDTARIVAGVLREVMP